MLAHFHFAKLTKISCASKLSRNILSKLVYWLRYCPKKSKIVKILRKLTFLRFWLFFFYHFSWTGEPKATKFGSYFTLLCLVQNWFEVLPMGTSPSIPPLSRPCCYNSPHLPSAATQKKKETLSYPTSNEWASNSFYIRRWV